MYALSYSNFLSWLLASSPVLIHRFWFFLSFFLLLSPSFYLTTPYQTYSLIILPTMNCVDCWMWHQKKKKKTYSSHWFIHNLTHTHTRTTLYGCCSEPIATHTKIDNVEACVCVCIRLCEGAIDSCADNGNHWERGRERKKGKIRLNESSITKHGDNASIDPCVYVYIYTKNTWQNDVTLPQYIFFGCFSSPFYFSFCIEFSVSAKFRFNPPFFSIFFVSFFFPRSFTPPVHGNGLKV